MQFDVLFAGIPTSDLRSAIEWYSALLGWSPDIEPNDTEVMWRLNDGTWLLVLLDAQRAGTAVVNVAVPDLDAVKAETADRGKYSSPIEVVEGAGRKARYVDLEGNTITFIEVASS